MYDKVLVPLDSSPYAECVLEHVKVLAAGCKIREVVLLFAVEPLNPGVYEVPLNIVEDARQKILAFGKEYIAGVAEKLKTSGLIVTAEVVQGKAAESILEYAGSKGIDLIAMTTHGRSGISRWVMGSVADRVIRGAPVPVLLVTPPGCRISE